MVVGVFRFSEIVEGEMLLLQNLDYYILSGDVVK